MSDDFNSDEEDPPPKKKGKAAPKAKAAPKGKAAGKAPAKAAPKGKAVGPSQASASSTRTGRALPGWASQSQSAASDYSSSARPHAADDWA